MTIHFTHSLNKGLGIAPKPFAGIVLVFEGATNRINMRGAYIQPN